jgi:hypothetical protein
MMCNSERHKVLNDICKVLNKVNDLPLYGVPDDDIQDIRKGLYNILDYIEGSRG